MIGLGVGSQHALALLADQRAELVGVCDSNEGLLSATAGRYASAQRFTNSSAMLDSLALDAVVIASHDWDHGEMVLAALDRGLHVFAEKPIAVSRPELEAIANSLRSRPHLRLTTNTLLRRSPRFMWLKDAVVRGEFGGLVHMQGDYLYGRLIKLTRGWRGSRDDYSVTLGGTVHMIDLLLWLAEERPLSVMAIGSRAGIEKSQEGSRSSFGGESLRAGLLTFDSGLTAQVSANFASIGPHFHRFDIFGTEATFMNLPTAAVDGGPPESVGLILRGPDPGTADSIHEAYPAVPKGVLLPEFITAITNGSRSPVSEQEAIDVLSVCLALDESIAEGNRVTIHYEDLGRTD